MKIPHIAFASLHELFHFSFSVLALLECLKDFVGAKMHWGKKQEWEIIVRITQQDGWMTFCPCFSWAKPLQCLKLSTCLSILLIWSQNTQNCIWLVPPNLLLKQLQNWSAPTISWAHLVQTQPFPSKETDYIESPGKQGMKTMLTFSFVSKGTGKIKQHLGNDAFQEPIKTGILMVIPMSQVFVITPWALSHLDSSEYKAARRLTGL